MDQLNAMRTFVSVIDEGSFINAARALAVAPAAVTRAVADLEAHLGARLLMRTTRSRSLTEVGQDYLARSRRILAKVAEAEALAGAARTVARGHVRLRAGPSFAVHQLAARLGRFHAMHPQVTVEVTANAPADAPDETHDITLVAQREPLDGEFVAHRLARTEIVACAQPAFLNRVGRPVHPGQLASHHFLMPAVRAQRRTVTFVHSEHGDRVTVIPPASALSSANHDLNHAAAQAGLGIAGLPSFLAQHALHSGELERVLPDWRLFDMTIWACLPSPRHVPASTRALLDFLRAEFGGEDRDPWAVAPGQRPVLSALAA